MCNVESKKVFFCKSWSAAECADVQLFQAVDTAMLYKLVILVC